jgi:hypothetical protein
VDPTSPHPRMAIVVLSLGCVIFLFSSFWDAGHLLVLMLFVLIVYPRLYKRFVVMRWKLEGNVFFSEVGRAGKKKIRNGTGQVILACYILSTWELLQYYAAKS